MVNWDWSQGDKPEEKFKLMEQTLKQSKREEYVVSDDYVSIAGRHSASWTFAGRHSAGGTYASWTFANQKRYRPRHVLWTGESACKTIKMHFFFKKQPFLNCRLLRNGSFFRKVTFHILNVKRVILQLLFRSFYRIWRLRFLIRRQSRPDIFFLKRRK